MKPLDSILSKDTDTELERWFGDMRVMLDKLHELSKKQEDPKDWYKTAINFVISRMYYELDQ